MIKPMMQPVPSEIREFASIERKPAVHFQRIAKAYGAVTALHELDLRVDDGEFLTILGPSGSGKSTLLGLTVGSIQPSKGTIHFRDQDVTRLAPNKRNVGMVFQRYTLFPNKTVAENVAFPLQLRGMDKEVIRGKVTNILSLVDLLSEKDRYPSEISGGQAQRVAVARALVFEPSILLMDEPLAALDKALRSALQDEIQRIQRATRVPTIYVTHDQDEAMHMSDRIVIIRDGRIVANGSPRELYEQPPNLWSAKFLGSANVMEVVEQRRDGQQVRVTCDGGLSFVFGPSQDLPIDEVATAVVLRPERCQIESSPFGTSAYRATLVHVTYLGGRQRVTVQLESGKKLIADVPGHWRAPAPGSTVYCSWDQDALRLVGQ